MAFGDPLQWLIIGIVVLAVLGAIVYIILRILRTLNKADKYFDKKEKGSGQPSPVSANRVQIHQDSTGSEVVAD